jgi:RNA polymerase subunit RPABC4/transcription elongation factor Spt4
MFLNHTQDSEVEACCAPVPNLTLYIACHAFSSLSTSVNWSGWIIIILLSFDPIRIRHEPNLITFELKNLNSYLIRSDSCKIIKYLLIIFILF